VVQVNPHFVPSQVAVPCVGVGHAVQEVPQLATLAFAEQVPPQSWLPPGQSPPHDIASGTHAVAHSFVPAGQVAPQELPSQVASPPTGTKHGLQLCPQCVTSMFDTHYPPHRCAFGPQPVSALPASEATEAPSRLASSVPVAPPIAPPPASTAPAPAAAPPSVAPTGMVETDRADVHAIKRSTGVSQTLEPARRGAPCLVIALSV
jgi:hypothetical protein